MMYALVTLWQLPEAPFDGLPPQPEQAIVSLFRQSPGFVEGYWTYERANGKSIGFILLETADHAHDLKNALESRMEGQDNLGVQLEMIRVQEIVAYVPADGASVATATTGEGKSGPKYPFGGGRDGT
jgi:hypothetical protein